MHTLKSFSQLEAVCLSCLVAILLSFFVVVPTGSAFAQGGKNPKTALKKNDKNKDGKVSRKEWRKSSDIFDRIDTNKDDYLTLKEFKNSFSGEEEPDNAKNEGSPSKIESNNPHKISRAAYGVWYENNDYWQGPIIDVHSQVDQKTNLANIIPLLDRAGVIQSILSTRFSQPSSDILTFAAQHPDRIIPAAKTKTKAFMKGHDAFPNDFYKEIKRFNFGTMAEIIMWHAAKKGVGAGKAAMDPDDSRLEPLVKTAKEKGWPFIAHVEFAAMGYDKSSYMQKFKTFLSNNQEIPIGLIHMGQLKAKDAAELLPQHSNLFFITSHCNPVTTSASNLPWTRMIKGEKLTPAWEELVIEYPDRFVLAFDNVFHFHWEKKFTPQVLVWRKALKDLPDNIAHALAHGNAERIWRLPPATLQ